MQVSKWPSVVGKLEKFTHRSGDGDISSITVIRYTYEVEGKTYKGRRLAMLKMKGTGIESNRVRKMMDRVERTANNDVVLYYNPQKPSKSFLLKPSTGEYKLLVFYYLAAAGILYLALNIK